MKIPNKPTPQYKIEQIKKYHNKGYSIGGIAKNVDCSRPTVKKYINLKKPS